MFFKRALILIVICNSLSDGSPVSSVKMGHKGPKLKLPQQKATESNKVCLTRGCTDAANSILKRMDPTINPCDNFYLFACGRFLNETQSSYGNTDMFSPLEFEIMEQLNMSISEPESDNDIKPIKMVKQFYASCMDRKLGLDPMKKILKRLGGWPVLEGNWDERSFDWKQSVYKFRQEGFPIDYILTFLVSADPSNSSRRVIHIDSAHLGIHRDYLVKGMEGQEVKRYYNSMVKIAEKFGANRKLATEDLRKSLEFEITLANISAPEASDYTPMNISEMQQQFPSIPWLEYINKILVLKHGVSDNEELFIKINPNYVEKLEILMNTSSKRTQANYMMWKAVATFIAYPYENPRSYPLDFNPDLIYMIDSESRWTECVNTAAQYFPVAVGSMYVKRFFNKDGKRNVLDMVKRLRKEMYKILKSADWLDKKTRKNAIAKLQSMFAVVAYPDELLDDRKVEKFYAKFEIPQNDFIGFLLSVIKFTYENTLSALHKSINRTDWTDLTTPTVVNAMYYPSRNSLQIPAGILQGVFFSNDRPKYLNYGAIGFFIGHEITHGFDNQGALYDKNGNFADWWEPKTKERFLAKIQCIIEQYGNYTAEEVGMKLDGIQTQGENIADNGGIKEAYYGYKSWVRKNRPEPRLPGLQKYSPQQMFWLSAAGMWCEKDNAEKLKDQITGDPHSPAAFRVIGTVSNHKEFANDYQCPLGSKMNPKKKCEVW